MPDCGVGDVKKDIKAELLLRFFRGGPPSRCGMFFSSYVNLAQICFLELVSFYAFTMDGTKLLPLVLLLTSSLSGQEGPRQKEPLEGDSSYHVSSR